MNVLAGSKDPPLVFATNGGSTWTEGVDFGALWVLDIVSLFFLCFVRVFPALVVKKRDSPDWRYSHFPHELDSRI